jgi:hypothetical protein
MYVVNRSEWIRHYMLLCNQKIKLNRQKKKNGRHSRNS